MRSKLYGRIWGFDSDITLSSVQNLLALNYQESIGYLAGRNDLKLSVRDSTLMHHWSDTSSVKTYTTQTKHGSEKIRYFTAKGNFETAVPSTSAFTDEEQTTLLSRERRVYEHESHVIFLQKAERLYSIVYGNNAAEKVRSILMGNGFTTRRKTAWGKIDTRLAQYSLSSDFFYWAFHKQQNNAPISTSYGNVSISDVEGMGRLSERNQHNTKGTGSHCIEEISNKSALGINQTIYESDFFFSIASIQLVLNLKAQAECVIDVCRSLILNPQNGQFDGIQGREDEVFLKLYLEVIPGLLGAYNGEISKNTWTNSQAIQAQKDWALEVIEDLGRHHNLQIQDITSLSYFGGSGD